MKNPWMKLPGSMNDARHIFAIGDVHGQADILALALEDIRKTHSAAGARRALVFTGDIIDRGPANLRCIEMVMGAASLAQVDDVIFLPGNHELMMIDGLLYDPDMLDLWVSNGGMAVLEELDRDARLRSKAHSVALAREKLKDFIDFIAGSPNYLRVGDLLFVHAGLNPHYEQSEFLSRSRFGVGKMSEHWAWVRHEFLSWNRGWDPERRQVVVHGHTPHHKGNNRIQSWDAHSYFDCVAGFRRICIDAGACSTGQLAIAEFFADQYRIGVMHHPKYLDM